MVARQRMIFFSVVKKFVANYTKARNVLPSIYFAF